MLINIVGLPRTGTTYLYKVIFRGCHKLDHLNKFNTDLITWDEPWIINRKNFNLLETTDNFNKKIDIFNQSDLVVVKNHYDHLADLAVKFPDIYKQFFSKETYTIKIFRRSLLSTVISNILLNEFRSEPYLSKDRDSNGQRYLIRKINIDAEHFARVYEIYGYDHVRMYYNPLNLKIDEFVLYEQLETTSSAAWSSLDISKLEKFKYVMPANETDDMLYEHKNYKKADLIENYEDLVKIAKTKNVDHGNLRIENGNIYMKGIDF